MNRILQILITLSLIIILLLPILLISMLIKIDSNGPVLHWSERVGMNNKIFLMPKFRTMVLGTPQVATHLLHGPESYLTRIGSILRKYSLDEIPQLFSILKGDMHFVGPRPALYNQDDLIQLRKNYNLDLLKPGVTGWAQINGRDELSIKEKVEYEREYMVRRSFLFNFYIILITFKRLIRRDGVSH